MSGRVSDTTKTMTASRSDGDEGVEDEPESFAAEVAGRFALREFELFGHGCVYTIREWDLYAASGCETR